MDGNQQDIDQQQEGHDIAREEFQAGADDAGGEDNQTSTQAVELLFNAKQLEDIMLSMKTEMNAHLDHLQAGLETFHSEEIAPLRQTVSQMFEKLTEFGQNIDAVIEKRVSQIVNRVGVSVDSSSPNDVEARLRKIEMQLRHLVG